MVEEVILHIGMHKTGSSSIQASLKEYDDGETRYARFDTVNHSSPITTIFTPEPARVRVHNNLGRGEEEIDDLKKRYTAQLEAELQSPGNRLVISGETISLLRKGPIENLRDYLAQHAVRTQVIAYVRPPVGFASSAFQQRLKQQDPRALDLTIPTAIPRPEYRQRFEKFIDAFGRDNVTFVKFSKDVLQGSVVDHFCGLIGIPESTVSDSKTNESLPLEAASLLYEFNRNGPVSRGAQNLQEARIKLARRLGNWFDTRFQIPPELITSNWDLADIEWMEDIAGFDLRPTESELAKSEGSSTYRTLEEYVAPISGGSIRTLKKHLRRKGIRFLPDDRAVDLITRLYYSFLIQGGRKSRVQPS